MIEPGHYVTRDGRSATVARVSHLVASGSLDGKGGEVWRADNGRWNLHGEQEHPWDLVRRTGMAMERAESGRLAE